MPQVAYRGEVLSEIVPYDLATDREPWERQPDEPTLWYKRFYLMFCLSGVKRSLLGTYNRFREEHGRKRSDSYVIASWRYYYHKYRWVERATAYDDYMVRLVQDRIEDERVQMFRRHREQAQAWSGAAMAWLDKAEGHRISSGALALRAWLAGIDVETRSLVPPQILKLFEMSDVELLQFYDGLLATAVGGGEALEDEGSEG